MIASDLETDSKTNSVKVSKIAFAGYVQKITPGFFGEKKEDFYMKITDALYIFKNSLEKESLETIEGKEIYLWVKNDSIKIYLNDDTTHYFQILAANDKILEIRNYLLDLIPRCTTKIE